jgi:hypothetical protein
MTTAITVFAPFKLAAGKTETDLLKASDTFERDFVSTQPGVLRREIDRKSEGRYIDIVQLRSHADMQRVVELEKDSPVCRAFFAVMDMSQADEGDLEVLASLATYSRA